jgi:Cu/Ag efflux pump CusA
MSSPGAVSIPYLKLNEDVDLRLVKNQPFQSIDYSSNTIKVVVQVVNEVTDVWLKISNARRPIDVLENNKDVRELGISIKEMQATC